MNLILEHSTKQVTTSITSSTYIRSAMKEPRVFLGEY